MRSSCIAFVCACLLSAAALAQTPPTKPQTGPAEKPNQPAAQASQKSQQPKSARDAGNSAQASGKQSPANGTANGADGNAAGKAGAARSQSPAKTPARPPIPAVDRLNALVVAADFDGEPLETVLAKLADASGTNLIAQWDKLSAAGVSRDEPVTLHVKNITFRELLRRLMEGVEKPDAKLAYRAGRDMILLSTEEEFSGELVTKIYYVHDIIANDTRTPTIFVGRTVDVPTSLQPIVAPGAVAFQPIIQRYRTGQIVQFPNSSTRTDGDPYDPQQEMAKLIDTIMASVDPDSWDANGGRGTIRAFRDMLVVRNTPFVHQQLGGPLTE